MRRLIKQNEIQIPKFNTPYEFNEYLNKFDYGILYENRKINQPTSDEYAYKYKTLSPYDFFKYKIGVCWDYTSAEKEYFNTNFKDINWVKTFYIEFDDKRSSTHTFLVYKQNNKYYYFESSYLKYQGIYEFNNLNDIFCFVLKNMFTDDGHKSDFKIYEYNIDKFNLSCLEFMDYIVNSGNKINFIYKEGRILKRLIAENNITTKQAKQLLIDGNNRFVKNNLLKKDIGNEKRLELFENGQHPFAVIISCSDSRVPPEIIFDQSLGDLFVIRVAGNVIDPITMGSIEYAIDEFKCQIIVVMGHEQCGAVEAALSGNVNDKYVQPIIHKIQPSIDKIKNGRVPIKLLFDAVIEENIKESMSEINKSQVINNLIANNKLILIGAKYHMTSGEVEFLN